MNKTHAASNLTGCSRSTHGAISSLARTKAGKGHHWFRLCCAQISLLIWYIRTNAIIIDMRWKIEKPETEISGVILSVDSRDGD